MQEDARTEIFSITEKKVKKLAKLFLKSIFQRNLAKENEDVEVEEFVEGMTEMRIKLTTEDMKLLFQYIKLCSSDRKEEEAMSVDEFSLFFLQQWNSAELQRLQNGVLNKIYNNVCYEPNFFFFKKRPFFFFNLNRTTERSSHLIKDINSLEQIDSLEWELESRQMHEQLNELVARESQIVSTKEHILNQLNMFELTQGNACDEKKADKWNMWEVALKLRKEGLDEYATKFVEKKIDGSVFLFDITDEVLLTEIGIKKIHLSKFRRLVDDLKRKCLFKWESQVIEMATFIPICQLQVENINTTCDMSDEDERLIVQIEQLKEQKQFMEERFRNEISHFQTKLDLAHDMIEQAKKDGFLQSEADEDRSNGGSVIDELEAIPQIETGPVFSPKNFVKSNREDNDDDRQAFSKENETTDVKTEPDIKLVHLQRRC
ncbi:hypothetical protein RFI_02766 [Reticulomyxa filosa]|uniref:SAM domain-containing protein n=2 Tax=Reticulomyxa filosa TaxID=46433 RepID=X6P823_RETFI|nr:hypothetical protein RFI_02766 [Reticulomyxa filosa]|eukprot:ETO34331.1 hypothetical protein RFI_02766 [Reticulomyxa filosa]